MTAYFADFAWTGGEQVEAQVLITVAGGRIASVEAGVECPVGATQLRGVTVPGMANCHSHAFHRALRARTHRGGGSFWTWRKDMCQVAARLTPDSYFTLARAVYAEMALAGISCVGEFHYLHHDQGGAPYANANEMGDALIAAANEAGIRITLLDTCYLTGGLGSPLEDTQLRFGDGDADRWADRASSLTPAAHARVGAAIHSVRAVPVDALRTVAEWAGDRRAPLHFHLSEQRAENDACLAAHGCTPTQLLSEHDALGPRSTAVHATHLTGEDIKALAASRTTVCMTPTTERDLADGIGPGRDLADSGAPLTLGSDSNAVVDLLEEARGLELDERLRSERRGHWAAADLLRAATSDGHASLGWSEAGRIAPGALADFTTVSLDSVRLSGWDRATLLESVVFAAGAQDLTDVVVGGRPVVAGGRHALVQNVGGGTARRHRGGRDVTVRVLRTADHVRMPWRNGGGVTAQVACSPDGDGSSAFDWRVSFAEVEHSGPFSTFPGVDRVILLVEGQSMTLTVDGARHVLQPHQPFEFDGQSRTECDVQAPTLDLNVMTRRGRVKADLEVIELDQTARAAPPADDLLVAVLSGEVSVAHGDEVCELRACDVVLSSDGCGLTVAGTGTIAVVSLTFAD